MVSLLAAEQGVRASPRLWAEEKGPRPPPWLLGAREHGRGQSPP